MYLGLMDRSVILVNIELILDGSVLGTFDILKLVDTDGCWMFRKYPELIIDPSVALIAVRRFIIVL